MHEAQDVELRRLGRFNGDSFMAQQSDGTNRPQRLLIDPRFPTHTIEQRLALARSKNTTRSAIYSHLNNAQSFACELNKATNMDTSLGRDLPTKSVGTP